MAGRYSRRQFLWYGSAAFGTSLLLKACGGQNAPEASSGEGAADAGEGLRVAMVLPGIITDKAWNQSGFEGLGLIEEEQGAEVAYVEQVGQPDQVEALSDFARRGYNLIYAHGGQFDAAIEQVAAEFPDTYFIGVNGAISGDNYTSLQINSLQAGYICGTIGARLTQSNQLAYIAAQEFASTQQELRGFEMGAKSVNPEIEVRSTFTGDWNDAAIAKEATLALISAGADVIYQWLDNAAPAVLQTASEEGIYAFGNTADQLSVAPDAVITSPVKRIDRAIAYLADLYVKDEIESQVYTLGFEQSDILYLGEFGDFVPEAVQEQAMETKQALANDEIQLT